VSVTCNSYKTHVNPLPKAFRQASPTLVSLEWRAVQNTGMWERSSCTEENLSDAETQLTFFCT